MALSTFPKSTRQALEEEGEEEEEEEAEEEDTVWLNKQRVEKNPTPYWTLSDVSRTHKQHIEP